MKVSDYIAKTVSEYAKHLFLIPGGGCIHLVDSFSKTDMDLIANLHEQGASICAESYGQYTNQLGVALVTTGPGATNAVTGIASAWLDSIPVLLITGQVQNKDRVGDRGTRQIGFQEINSVSIYDGITKYAVTVDDASLVRYHLEKAIWEATNGRKGPVLIDVPLDIQAAEINPDELVGFNPKTKSDIRPITEYSMLKEADDSVRALFNAKRPMILVGNGVRLSGAEEEFLKFAKLADVPVLTSWKALDFFDESDCQYVGRPGGVGQRGANFNQQNADFILVIGARLDHGQLAYQPQYFAREATKCIVDIDYSEISKLGIHVEYELPMDAKEYLQRACSLIEKESLKSQQKDLWSEFCRGMYDKYPVILPEHLEDSDLISNYAFMSHLSDLLPSNSLVIPGSSGACSEVTMQAFKCKKGTRVYNSEGLGSMGFGIPAAIGGCLASDRRETICIDGDGGFVMNIQELELVRRYNLPIKFFILNNDGYGSIKTTQNTHFNGDLVASDPSSGLTLPSVELNAQAYRIPFVKIEGQRDLRKKIQDVLETSGPVVCELMVDPNHMTLPKASVYKKSDGSFATRPMEDLFPFLEREEFLSNLLVKEVTFD